MPPAGRSRERARPGAGDPAERWSAVALATGYARSAGRVRSSAETLGRHRPGSWPWDGLGGPAGQPLPQLSPAGPGVTGSRHPDG